MNKTAREYAYNILIEILLNDAYSNIAINKEFRKNNISEKDKRYISEIVYGSIKNKIYIEYIIKTYSKGRIKSKLKILLVMAIYQILFMDKTPDFAVVNETVEISKKIFGKYDSKFINALLRNIIRTFDEYKLVFEDDIQEICIKNSCSESLYKILENQYGKDKAISIIKSFNNKSKNSIRINYNKISKQELINYFNKKDIGVEESNICEDCLLLEKLNVDDISFKEGKYIIQDEASALVACTLNYNEDEKLNILDVCSAPGGKSLHIATKYFNSNLTSCDKYIHKLNLLNSNKERLGINNIEIKEQDATILNLNFVNNFDVVICDVPCSGIGVIKNKPEIKYKITDSYIEDISELQYKILENSSNYVKKNGLLIYSTCTIDKRENEKNIEKFLSNNLNYKLEKIELSSIVKEEKLGIINILPDEFNCDGFFIAKIRKMED